MSSLQRIFKKISQEQTNKKTALKRATLKGFVPSARDIKNLKILDWLDGDSAVIEHIQKQGLI